MLRLARVTDTDDPEGLARITVEYFGHEEGAVSDWAPFATPMAGDAAGFFVLPEVGDLVAVGFLDDDLDRPVVLGALWNGMQKPPADKPTERGFVSRTGHSITFSDGDDDGITLKDSHGNTIVMNKDGISIETGKAFKITVGGTTAFETSGEATFKGSPIQLNP